MAIHHSRSGWALTLSVLHPHRLQPLLPKCYRFRLSVPDLAPRH